MPRQSLRILLTFCFVFILTVNGRAQSSNSAIQDTDSLNWFIEMKYGLDQELINGFLYYNQHPQYKGDPYFPEDLFYRGSVSLSGASYDDVLLKYDSYSQHLILKYTDYYGRMNHLILNEIHIDSFCLEANCFKNLSLDDGETRFYQVIESGSVSCYIYWRRDIHTTSYDFTYTHEYGDLKGIYYIRYMGNFHPIANRKELLGIFPNSLQPDIKRYLRQVNFRLKEAGPEDFQNLLSFISSGIENPSQH